MSIHVARRTGNASGPRGLGFAVGLLLGTCAIAAGPATAAETKPAKDRLSAEQVVERHVAARGGLDAWRGVQALSFTGKLDAGAGDSIERSMRVARGPGAATRKTRREAAVGSQGPGSEKQVQLPFTLARKLPNLSRLELEFAGKTALQVFDGTQGWKVRPFLNRADVEPMTADEVRAVGDGTGLDDPIIDAVLGGRKVALERVEPVEGHEAYKLKVTTGDGTVRHVWVDAHTFLDVKVEGAPRRMDGKMRDVWVFNRDFRTVQDLKIPFVRETFVDGSPQGHSIVLDKVAVNPALDAGTFAKPKA